MSQRLSPIQRALEIALSENPLTGSGAAFLWGPRQTGKTTLLRQRFPEAAYFDLLDSDLSAELAIRPHILRERVIAAGAGSIIVDEIQKIPALLDEIHWLLENRPVRCILCGSSARKLKRGARDLLGGRAVENYLHPLTTGELPDMDLRRLLNHGGLPAHYLARDPALQLRAYVNNYIKEEIIDESLARNVPSFARFLEAVSLTHGALLNYANMARESGVSASTVRNYYQILEDTLLGFQLPPWRRAGKRRLCETAKFYLFDVGVANALRPESPAIVEGSDLFGRAFEHFIINEVRAFLAYRHRAHSVSFWKTSSGFEVDLVIGQALLAVECKASLRVRGEDLKGLRAFKEEHGARRAVVVSREPEPRTTDDGIEIIPWRLFCSLLWGDRLV